MVGRCGLVGLLIKYKSAFPRDRGLNSLGEYKCHGRFSFIFEVLIVSHQATSLTLNGLLTCQRERKRFDFKLFLFPRLEMLKLSKFFKLNGSTCQFYYKVNTCVKPYRKNGRG